MTAQVMTLPVTLTTPAADARVDIRALQRIHRDNKTVHALNRRLDTLLQVQR